MKKCLFVLLVIAYCVASFLITYNVINFQPSGDAEDGNGGLSLSDVGPFLKTRLRINLYINKEENGTEKETKITQDIELDPKDEATNYNIFLNVDEPALASKGSPSRSKSRRLKGTTEQPSSSSAAPSKDDSMPSLSFSSIPRQVKSKPMVTTKEQKNTPAASDNRALQDSSHTVSMIQGATQVKPCFLGNVDFRGADLQIRRTTSALACQLVCREREPKCKFFTWITQEHPDPHLHGICYMKISEGGATQAHGAISGPEVCSAAVDGQS